MAPSGARPVTWMTAVLAVVLASAPAVAQITLTHADVDARLRATGSETTYEISDGGALPGLQALADRWGSGQVWDVSAFPWTVASVRTYAPAAPPVPGWGLQGFQEATHIVAYTEDGASMYGYFRLEGDALTTLGVATEGEDGTGGVMEIGFRLAPYDLTLPLPLTSSSSWSSAYTFELVPANPWEASETAEEVEVVEGWGTLVTPAGSAPTLKVRTRTITSRIAMIPGGGSIVSRDTSFSVEWLSAGPLGAALDLDRGGTVTGATYTVNSVEGGGTAGEGPEAPRDGLGLAVRGRHPVRRGDRATVEFALTGPTDVRLEAYDVVGRRVAVLEAGPRSAGAHRAEFPTDGLPAGVYRVRLGAAGQTATLPVTVVE